MSSVEQDMSRRIDAAADSVNDEMNRPDSEVSADAKLIAMAIREAGLRIQLTLMRR